MTADAVIRLLGLKPHPEGGHFAETFRDGASTAIYYLLRADERSHWHRIAAAEIWHWYAGASLELSIARPGAGVERLRLGPGLAAGERPQAVVPPKAWQAAHSLGDYTLVGCTVAPPFDFAGFELAPPGWSPSGAPP
jgi:hypothetical protein